MTVASEDSAENPPPPYEQFAHDNIRTTRPTTSQDASGSTAPHVRYPYSSRHTESEVLLVQQVRLYHATRTEALRNIPENERNGAEDGSSFSLASISMILLVLWSVIATCLLIQTTQATDDDAFSWGRMQPGACVKRGIRETFARLAGSSPWTRPSACWETANHNGTDVLKPLRCKQGWWSQYGFWQQNGSEYCTPEWNVAEPRECVSYATRRWSAQLSNVHYDRNRACHETPITIPGGASFENPEKCLVSRKSVQGEWFVRNDEDAACIPRWIDLHPGRCKVYDVREYTAHLTHITYSPWIACLDTPLEVHERRQGRPHDCRLIKHGVMEGVWHVGDEPYCRPYWGSIGDNGCVAGGYRRYHSRLWNIRGASWTDMCQTTPVVVAGQAFQGAMLCIDKGFRGMWGEWVIPDERCSNFVASEPEDTVSIES